MIDDETGLVRHVVRIAAPPQVVWDFWTVPERMTQWWGHDAQLDVRPGGALLVELGNGAVMRGEFVELVPFERIVFSFGWDPTEDGPEVAPGSTTVEVSLAEKDGATTMTLEHRGLPTALLGDHDEGWGYFTGELAAAASV